MNDVAVNNINNPKLDLLFTQLTEDTERKQIKMVTKSLLFCTIHCTVNDSYIYVQKTPHKINQLNKEEMFSFPKEKNNVDGLCFYGIQACILAKKR